MDPKSPRPSVGSARWLASSKPAEERSGGGSGSGVNRATPPLPPPPILQKSVKEFSQHYQPVGPFTLQVPSGAAFRQYYSYPYLECNEVNKILKLLKVVLYVDTFFFFSDEDGRLLAPNHCRRYWYPDQGIEENYPEVSILKTSTGWRTNYNVRFPSPAPPANALIHLSVLLESSAIFSLPEKKTFFEYSITDGQLLRMATAPDSLPRTFLCNRFPSKNPTEFDFLMQSEAESTDKSLCKKELTHTILYKWCASTLKVRVNKFHHSTVRADFVLPSAKDGADI